MSSSNDRRRVAKEKKAESKHAEKAANKRESADKEREKAQKKAESATRAKSRSVASQRARAANRSERKAAALDKAAAAESKQEARASVRAGRAEDSLRSSVLSERRRDELADKRRRKEELAHARRVASERTSGTDVSPAILPRRTKVKLALLTASPASEERIRVDQEAREIREALKRAVVGTDVEVTVWTAATADDVLHALNDDHPDIVHFSGHGSEEGLFFDEPDDVDADGVEYSYSYLGRAFAATDWPPKLVVLNACYSFAGVEDVLSATPAVVAMTESVTDIGAKAFAAKLYAAVGSGQSLQSSFNQAKLALDAVTGEGDKAELIVVDGVSVADFRLVTPPAEGD